MNTAKAPLLTGPERLPAEGRAVKSAVVFLHGYGADGEDLINLAPLWAPHLPNTAFFAPHAPSACEINPLGRQWFGLQDRSLEAMWHGLEAAAPLLESYLASLIARFPNLAREQSGYQPIALAGFSQGGMLALHTGLRRPVPPAALLGYSTMLVGGADRLPKSGLVPLRILLVHGTMDPILPFRCMDQAASALKNYGAMVETLIRPGLGHGIDSASLETGLAFLKSTLS